MRIPVCAEKYISVLVDTHIMDVNVDSNSGRAIVVRVDPDLEDLIPGYLHNRENDIKTMIEKCAQSDFESIRILAHKIKGSGGGYGFDRITDIAGRIEESAKEKSLEGINRGIHELTDFLNRVRVVYE